MILISGRFVWMGKGGGGTATVDGDRLGSM